MVITVAATDAERAEVLALFQANFHDIAANAVPMSDTDHLYPPVIARYSDPATGQLVGAALSCRAQVAAGAILRMQLGQPDGGYGRLVDKHSELDLMCVTPRYQGQGIGGKLVEFIEAKLRAARARVWFGNATEDLDLERLRDFYTRHGFTVLPNGQPLPPLLGKIWTPPSVGPTGFYFYKSLL